MLCIAFLHRRWRWRWLSFCMGMFTNFTQFISMSKIKGTREQADPEYISSVLTGSVWFLCATFTICTPRLQGQSENTSIRDHRTTYSQGIGKSCEMQNSMLQSQRKRRLSNQFLVLKKSLGKAWNRTDFCESVVQIILWENASGPGPSIHGFLTPGLLITSQ